jgi:hypothetical protein
MVTASESESESESELQQLQLYSQPYKPHASLQPNQGTFLGGGGRFTLLDDIRN